MTYGCSTDSEPGTVIETGFTIAYVDQDENDLLDPAHPNAITEGNTDLYYLINGEMVKQYENHLDHPKKFSVVTEEKLFDRYFMHISPNTIEGLDTAITYITYLEFENNSLDTIKTQYRRPSPSSNSIFVTKIWYNGELRWDVDDKSLLEHPNNEYVGRYFTVTRNLE
ncbi:MAG: hypothetical protein WD016_09575 [Balneolaceae bacterium]